MKKEREKAGVRVYRRNLRTKEDNKGKKRKFMEGRKKESGGLLGFDETTGIIMRSLSTDGLTLWSGTMKSGIDNTLSVNFESVKDHSDLTLTFFIGVLQIYLWIT